MKWCVVLIAFFLLQFAFFRPHTQSFYFEDETEHVTPAWMMLHYGQRLYTDLSTNHQPLPILTALGFLNVVRFNTLFMLIERLRQFMMALSLVGALFITWRFGFRGLVAAMLVETIKFYLFGYHLLAESLVVYPLMYVAGVLAERAQRKAATHQNIDDILMPLTAWWSVFNFLPSVIMAIPSLCIYWLTSAHSARLRIFLVGALATLLLAVIVSPSDWFAETIVNNWRYFLPYEKTALLPQLVYPLQGFLHLWQPLPTYLAITMVLAFWGIALQLKRDRHIGMRLLVLCLLVMCLNLRVTRTDVAFYEAFHVLPMIAALTMLASAIVPLHRRLVVSLLIGGLLFSNTRWWPERINKMDEHFIQYGELQAVSSALLALKQPGDTLLVGPLHGFITVMADIPLADGQNAHLPWSWRSEILRRKFETMMAVRPPTFVYFPVGKNPYFEYLEPKLASDYAQLERSDGRKTALFMKREALATRSSAQWQDLSNLLFTAP